MTRRYASGSPVVVARPIPRSRSSVVVGRRVSADDDDACGGRGRRARRRTTPDGVGVDGTGARRDARGVASDSRASNAWDRVRWRARGRAGAWV